MDTTFTNSKNSKTSEPSRLLLDLTDKINLKRSNKHVNLSNLNMHYKWENVRSHAKTINLKYQLPH